MARASFKFRVDELVRPPLPGPLDQALQPEQVREHAKSTSKRSFVHRFLGRQIEFQPPEVNALQDGILVRLSERPRTRHDLIPLLLPAELVYRERPPTTNELGARTVEAAKPEDQATTIPRLSE